MSSRLKWQQWLRLFLQNSCTSWRLYRLSAKDMVSLRQISGAARGGAGRTQGWEGQQEGRREIRQSLCLKRGRWQEINIHSCSWFRSHTIGVFAPSWSCWWISGISNLWRTRGDCIMSNKSEEAQVWCHFLLLLGQRQLNRVQLTSTSGPHVSL